ncbi:MAG TPA: universal stress protein [Thermodesulfobacteriota bacterium]|nr:universal stress protein [Thermodesulfobacteriota bacterium]
MISRILAATDGSPAAERAVEYAADLAKQTGSALALLAVKDEDFSTSAIPSVPDPENPGVPETTGDYLEQMSQAALDRAEEICGAAGVSAERMIASGETVDAIVREANRINADLIVIGARRRKSLAAKFLGSVSHGVIEKESRIPVLVVREDDR